MISVHPYTLFGTLEALIIVLVLAVVTFVKWRNERRNTESLRQELNRTRVEVKREIVERIVEPSEPQRDYGDFLREQIERSSALLGEVTQPQIDAGQEVDQQTLARQMLAARHQFLQLEMDMQRQASEQDVEAQRRSVIEGMQALLAGLTAHAEAVETDVVSDATEAASTDSAPRLRSEEDKLREQISYLRSVIDNQHSVMRELRQLLEEHGGDSEELQEALRKLSDAEAQGIELGRCLEVMEQENERLKLVAGRNEGPSAAVNPDADMLRDLVGSQQRTISKLQHMLQTLAPDSGKAGELADAIGKIQRANNELNSCVMVLEDENTMLRGQVETLQERLADLEANGIQAPIPNAPEIDRTGDTAGEPTPEIAAQVQAVADTDSVDEPEQGSVGISSDEAADDDVDALLEAASTQTEIPVLTELGDTGDGLGAAEAGEPVRSPESSATDAAKAQPPRASGGASESGDIDALLAELFADGPQTGTDSKP